VNGQNSPEMYPIETERFSLSARTDGEKTRGEKMKAYSTILLKTNVEKMSELPLSTMLMKTQELGRPFHDV
jgi:hypothetical protein